jgi:hypothetical protein
MKGGLAMRSKKSRLLFLLMLFFGIANYTDQALAQEPFTLTSWGRFFAGIDLGYQWISGDFVIPAGGQPGSGGRIYIGPDLGVDQTESISILGDGQILNNHFVNIEYFMCLATGLKRIQRELMFHNRLYPEDSLVDTRIDMNWLRITYAFKFLDIDSWAICPSFGFHYVGCGVSLNGETEKGINTSNTRRLDAIYPTVGIQARYPAPYGLDFRLEWEGMHLITMGLISSFRLSTNFEIYPDVRFDFGFTHRMVSSVENNQTLNNEWFYNLTGVAGGVSFGF